ncbi:phospholipid-transporting ATPase 11C isoform X2 [Sitodiplosis mosellana]|uniref:phospholipid-transporting ATPase 11C isoform X2 n=1 Tax=Sitodiplosis mosellana TaxID=263140 RepID=UPI00244465DB|nr:phospholipid-transporting ATPase 11C isoform X2 [Sitodiplosis mosellana]
MKLLTNMGNRVSTESDSIAIRIGSIDDCDNDGNVATEKRATSSTTTTTTTTTTTSSSSPPSTKSKGSFFRPSIRNKKAKRPIANNRVKSTNYTLITFLPKNLYEQFKRIANFYFLIMTTLASVIDRFGDSPVSIWTSLLPLVFVISVTAIKQGYEDYLRHKADNLVNRSYATVIRNGVEIDIKCEDILRGDLVKASRDCDVPCDLVLLKTSDPDGKCYVTTANLDGETNLKALFVPKGFPNDVSIEKLHDIGSIECDQPLADLYTFNGRLEIGPTFFWRQHHEPTFSDTLRRHRRTLPLTADHLLLRGSRIKNTEWAIGCAVYCGQNTKLALNGKVFRSKNSSSERFIDQFLILFVLVMITLVASCCGMKIYYDSKMIDHNVYLGDPKTKDLLYKYIGDFLSFLILFNYLIPISLYVTIEMHKFLGSLFLEWDLDLYDVEMNQQCLVNTSNLNDELGQVKILFSDKTGTLTKNEMILQQCSINGKKYKIQNFGLREENSSSIMRLPQYDPYMRNFFQTLTTCHTVQVAKLEKVSEADDAEMKGSFEMVESSGSLVEIEEDVKRKAETEQNTKQNEVCLPSNPLENMPAVQLRREHRRVASASSGIRKISFSKENKIAILANFPVGARDFAPKIPSPLTVEPPFPFRPERLEYKRTLSTKVGGPQERITFGHRRTQSLNVPQNQVNQFTGKNELRKSIYNRSSTNIANTREFYAAPAYNEASLLERQESMRLSTHSIGSVTAQFDYQASSPDEKALVEGCAKVGYIFTGEKGGYLNIKLQSQRPTKGLSTNEINVERLYTLEFTSDRKRMSTIIKDGKGDIWLYTKGAESHVFPLCLNTSSQQNLMKLTQQHIDDFAKVGLRTLAVARRKLTLEEYNQFDIDITNASNALANRKTQVEQVQAKIENNLELLGATAVEDALQDKVKDTIESLRYAGIIVWVLTGDKIETALNIARSCGQIPDSTETFMITECKEEYQINQHMDMLDDQLILFPYRPYSLLVDGASLSLLMKHCPERFRDLAMKCQAVLCCRLSPLQKCQVVKLMKTLPNSPVTAAIGDGANDVSMIREAHVGLGILGKEGRQAALCSDYSFTNFYMLKKILLVHGHFFSYRFSILVLYFFYKNLVFMLIQVYFQLHNQFSAQTIYASIFLTFYNVMYTSMPILLLSITEKPYREDQLLKNPSLYMENSGNKRITWKYFLAWITLAVFHSMVVYFIGYAFWMENNMKTNDLDSFGAFMIHNVVFVVTIKLWLISRYRTIIFALAVFLSIFAFMSSTIVFNLLPLPGSLYNVYNHLVFSYEFWVYNVLICFAALIPDRVITALKIFNIKVRPTDTISDGWNRLFKDAKNSSMNQSTNSNSESTYL